MSIAESDWKKFRKVRENALDRFCRIILKECEAITRDDSRTAHARYGDLYGYLHDRNREMAAAFDDCRRSTAVLCLMHFQALGVLEDDEISQFSERVQRSLEAARDM